MDCYSIQNPYKGQLCPDDELGNMVYDGSSWILANDNVNNILDDSGSIIGAKMPGAELVRGGSERYNPNASKSFLQKNWAGIMIAGICILLGWMLFKKKK